MKGSNSRKESHLENDDNSTTNILPTHHGSELTVPHNVLRVTTGIQPAGESGRKGIHPNHFFRICWRSSSRASRICNILWPVVPAAIAVKYSRPDLHLAIFILNYIAMIPCANLIGFAGQEMGRKLHKVFGVILETTLGSVVEIVMFMVLVRHDQFKVIQAAILGSVLATQLLCLGMCFAVGGIRHNELEFNEVVGEVGSDLLLTAPNQSGFGLIVPAAFHTAVSANSSVDAGDVDARVLHISRITAILLIIAYAIYTYFQIRTHESIYDAIFKEDEQHGDHGGHEVKAKLTFTECVIALAAAITLVTIIAISLVQEISFIVEDRGVSDSFVGLILVPLVEKFAEHLTAIDEAWNNEVNMALAHVLGATIQTSLFNGPLVVLVGWGLNKNMDLNFDLFNIIVLILAILVVGNFLRDQKSNYLEGSLCVIVYINIAVAAFYYPNPEEPHAHTSDTPAAAIVRGLLGQG
ncbi:related to vacuolar Ca2+/H+ antiporter [Phialocephala subalpina]|uniref:Related to vacuolar Ca2+/H+ antiporter n=1 Tax=Phialocephala subalpina TaxID=576137 RepID=A0A1L7XBA5_9HELO|nr:related to vacuolar Ca2+/H+ antiporter [Phialocephala subalpina]